jgi:hypothetical protein
MISHLRVAPLVALAAVALAACGSEDATTAAAPPTTSAPAAAPATTTNSSSDAASGTRLAGEAGAPTAELAIHVWPEGKDGPVQTYTLTCDPDGGTLPDAAGACAALRGPAPLFEAPAPDEVCTQQYGGPEVAQIDGRMLGDIAVSASFSRTNGCEIGRWAAAAALLPLPTGSAAP